MPKRKRTEGGEPRTLQEAAVYFTDPARALAYVVSRRWPNGVTCPTCGRKDVTFLARQLRWKCKGKHPKPQFSAKVGTIFEESPIPLGKWLLAMWLLANCKNGISSYELADAIGVTQKTAWFMLQRLRLAMQARNPTGGKLGGEVEVDETYIGGLARNMHDDRWRRTIGTTANNPAHRKTVVMGLLERHGRDKGHSVVRAKVVASAKKGQLLPNVRANVEAGSTVYTDQHRSYTALSEEYEHKVINHAECYVKGNVHTNGMENFWSLLKRSLKGTYISVEPFHLFRYVDEQAFRFNDRKASTVTRFDSVLGAVAGQRLTYQQLTGHAGS
jgi:transposase-like protein